MVFSVLLVDSAGDEIRATAFNSAADAVEPLLLCGSVVQLSCAKLRRTKRKFSVEGEKFELIMGSDTVIKPLSDDGSTPRSNYHFRPLDQLHSVLADAFVDVEGIVTHVDDLRELADNCLRSITLIDTSNMTIKYTLWRETARAASQSWQNPICAIEGARISRRNGLELSTVLSASCAIKAAIPEAAQLLQWRAANPNNIPRLQEAFPLYTHAQILGASVGSFVNVIATIHAVGETVTTAQGKASRRQEIRLVGCTTTEVSCTLWGSLADLITPSRVCNEVALQGCRITEYQGKQLTSTPRTTITLEPDTADIPK